MVVDIPGGSYGAPLLPYVERSRDPCRAPRGWEYSTSASSLTEGSTIGMAAPLAGGHVDTKGPPGPMADATSLPWCCKGAEGKLGT